MPVTWTPHLDSKERVGGNVVASVTFTSSAGERIVDTAVGNTLDREAIAHWCAIKIESLEARDRAFESLVIGPIVPQKRPIKRPV